MPSQPASQPQTRDGRPLVTRALRFAPASYDPETREFDAVLTTSAPVRRRDWATGREYDEVLDMAGVDLTRADGGGIPILDSHWSSSVTAAVGRILPGSVRVEGDTLVGRGRLTEAQDAVPVRERFADGTIREMSIGYSVDADRVEVEPGDVKTGRVERRIVRSWTLYEASLVTIPADPAAGARSATMEQQMATQQDPGQVVDLDAVRREAAAAERARVSEIGALARRHGVDLQAQVDGGATVEQARAAALDALAARSTQTQVSGSHRGVPTAGADIQAQRADAVVNGLLARGGVALPPGVKVDREVGGMSLLRLAEDCLRARGIEPRDHSEREVATLALQARRGEPLGLRSFAGAMSTGDFPLLLANAANKFLRAGYDMEPETHAPLVYDRQVRDTKQVSILSMGSVDALPQVAEGAEYTYGTIGEAREVYQLAKFGRILPLTVETLLNDDVSAFARLAQELGRAAMRTEKGLIYGSSGVLGANSGAGQTMAAHGSIAAATLIHATHGNAGSAGALSATTLAELRKLMLAQTDDDGNIIGGLMPQILLVPAALLDTAEILQQQRYVATTAGAGAAQWIAGLQVIVEPRLDAISATRFWATSGRPFIERARLAGEPAPVITTIESPETDAVGYKVRYWCATKAADWRDVASNAGA